MRLLWLIQPVNIVIGGVLNSVPVLGEELGWRGFLFPRLRELIGPGWAVLAQGIIWAGWHAPVILLGYNYPSNPWMWVVTASTAAYFCGTVPYIKSMIRERFNRPLLVGTVAAHALVAAAAVWLAAGGCLGWPHAVVWVALAVRSLVMPLRQWKLAEEKRPIPPHYEIGRAGGVHQWNFARDLR